MVVGKYGGIDGFFCDDRIGKYSIEEELSFQDSVHAFSKSVLSAMVAVGHAGAEFETSDFVEKIVATVLHATIGVVHQPLRVRDVLERHFERFDGAIMVQC